MSYPNKPELDQVCLCPSAFVWDRFMRASKHNDDCPFFSDNSHAESENEIYQDVAEYVF